jgi:hypothetical protein
MARITNSDQDFSAGYGNELDLENWRSEAPASLDELFMDRVIRERVGRLIASAKKSASK